MARRAMNAIPAPFTPITSEAEWNEQGWADEAEPLTAAPRLGAVISIRLDPDNAALVRRAARLLAISNVEFVQRVAVQAAAEAIAAEKQNE